jgi:hypothetical protein
MYIIFLNYRLMEQSSYALWISADASPKVQLRASAWRKNDEIWHGSTSVRVLARSLFATTHWEWRQEMNREEANEWMWWHNTWVPARWLFYMHVPYMIHAPRLETLEIYNRTWMIYEIHNGYALHSHFREFMILGIHFILWKGFITIYCSLCGCWY